MTGAVQELFDCFEMLSDAEKQEAAAELLRRVDWEDPGGHSDSALIPAADELLVQLDREEP
jgi:hypothetical protein